MKILIGRMLCDDHYGDMPGRRLEIAKFLFRENSTFDSRHEVCYLWVLNRVRDEEMKRRFFEEFGCSTKARKARSLEDRIVYRNCENPVVAVVDLPFSKAELSRCESSQSALLYLSNPNLARNAMIRYAEEEGCTHAIILDGDIYFPQETWRDVEVLLTESPTVPVWLFCVRSPSVEDFLNLYNDEARGKRVVDTCDNEFILLSSPAEIVRLGYESMLALPLPAKPFDESLEYGNDNKVRYCDRLKRTVELSFSSMPTCHLEHRQILQRDLPEEGRSRRQGQVEDLMEVRRVDLEELVRIWEKGRAESAGD